MNWSLDTKRKANCMIEASTFRDAFIDEPTYKSIISEYLDFTDMATLNTACSIQEADRSALIVSLTSKLYDDIVKNVDDIDFGSIPRSKGDNTKIENYEALLECISVIHDIVKEYNQDTKPVDDVTDAIANIRGMQKEFEKAFAMNLSMPIIIYNTMVLSCVASISMLIQASIEYIKNPNDTYKIALDKVAYAKTKGNILYTSLIKFNEGCRKGEIQATINYAIQTNAKQFGGEGIMSAVLAGTAIVAGIRFIIPMLRELVFFFFYAKQSVSDYFAVQADLLQVNANNLAYRDDLSDDKKNAIISKQSNIANKFRNISNKFAVKVKKAENDTNKAIASSNRKYRIDDLTDEKFDTDDSLF